MASTKRGAFGSKVPAGVKRPTVKKSPLVKPTSTTRLPKRPGYRTGV